MYTFCSLFAICSSGKNGDEPRPERAEYPRTQILPYPASTSSVEGRYQLPEAEARPLADRHRKR